MCDNTLVMEPCQAVPEGTPALSDHELHHLLTHVDDWELVDGLLEKVFHFEDHYQTMAFVNAVAWISLTCLKELVRNQKIQLTYHTKKLLEWIVGWCAK